MGEETYPNRKPANEKRLDEKGFPIVHTHEMSRCVTAAKITNRTNKCCCQQENSWPLKPGSSSRREAEREREREQKESERTQEKNKQQAGGKGKELAPIEFVALSRSLRMSLSRSLLYHSAGVYYGIRVCMCARESGRGLCMLVPFQATKPEAQL